LSLDEKQLWRHLWHQAWNSRVQQHLENAEIGQEPASLHDH